MMSRILSWLLILVSLLVLIGYGRLDLLLIVLPLSLLLTLGVSTRQGRTDVRRRKEVA